MPVYEYECDVHGVFEQLRPLTEYSEPGCCPTCRGDAPKLISVPHLCAVPRSTMIAHGRNEKSRYEPAVSSTKPGSPEKLRGEPQRPALRQYHGARPWVIEHG